VSVWQPWFRARGRARMRYHAAMRIAVVVLLALGACSREPEPAAGPAAAPVQAAAGAATGTPEGAGRAVPPHRLQPTAADALRAIVQPASGPRPRVLGIGEMHQTQRTAGVPSALSRFTHELMPVLAGHVTDLVIESWAEPAGCDAEAVQASAEVTASIERPASTENELVTMVERARALRIRPHLLSFGCEDYRALRGADGQVNYEALLGAVTARLREQALAGLGHEGAVIALYGGALHNDLHPNPGVADFSYAVAVDGAASGAYVEIDLIVPEYVTGNAALTREPWYPLVERAAPAHVVLIERAPRSYVLILPRSASSPEVDP
jgi:hypothetical protein